MLVSKTDPCLSICCLKRFIEARRSVPCGATGMELRPIDRNDSQCWNAESARTMKLPQSSFCLSPSLSHAHICWVPSHFVECLVKHKPGRVTPRCLSLRIRVIMEPYAVRPLACLLGLFGEREAFRLWVSHIIPSVSNISVWLFFHLLSTLIFFFFLISFASSFKPLVQSDWCCWSDIDPAHIHLDRVV